MSSKRQKDILAIAATIDRVEVDLLAERFGVTPQTIRRDLNELCDRGLLARVHGGARTTNSVANTGYEERRGAFAEEKRRIGFAAAAMIPDSSSMIINIGTTTEQVARGLYNHEDLVVVTNNINVATILSGSPKKEIMITGGHVRQSDGGVIGHDAVEFIRRFSVDFAIIGASAIDEAGVALDFDMREVVVARAIIAAARKTILVFDHSKFERRAPIRICDVGEIDIVVTDAEPPARFREICDQGEVEIVVAGVDAGDESIEDDQDD